MVAPGITFSVDQPRKIMRGVVLAFSSPDGRSDVSSYVTVTSAIGTDACIVMFVFSTPASTTMFVATSRMMPRRTAVIGQSSPLGCSWKIT